ncbi:MAG: 23S rRNA (adenine(2030)-N(6))-methyltransferase RlmJ [Treponema sp.]|nr:23S rRNA (adenine(2030)-N(6))-methyltransferase RlmJ [Treponema sp.]
MLSYLHSFHAGNHADILKHFVLLYTVNYFNKKTKPYTIFDTHSARGLYNLQSEESLKTGEAQKGILRVLDDEKNTPEQLKNYLSFVKQSIKNGFYPGSPCIEATCMQSGCNLFLTELHKTEFQELQKNISFRTDCFVDIQNKNGFEFVSKNTPPVLKRGFVLCDPSYEEKSDYINSAELFCNVHKKWSGATLLLWYPLLNNKIEEIENMKQAILSCVKNKNPNTEVLDCSLCVDTPDSHIETTLKDSIGSDKPRLYGSGMFIVNPCWGLKEELEAVLPYLSEKLANDGHGTFSVSML